ncbi:MAG: type II secretion system protein [Candidatus Microsaccharimonas sp.]
MGFTDIKAKNQGFTIVELLIVVVVIAILAAITIVSYNGITSQANASSAQSTAATVQKKIELYQAEEGYYPISKADLTATNESWTLPSASFGASAPTADGTTLKGTGYVQVRVCHTGTLSSSTVTGARITWWDYSKSSSQATDINLGTCTGTVVGIPA